MYYRTPYYLLGSVDPQTWTQDPLGHPTVLEFSDVDDTLPRMRDRLVATHRSPRASEPIAV
jgi:hypothetical protein